MNRSEATKNTLQERKQETTQDLADHFEFRPVFIHGAGGTRRVWRHQIAAFPNGFAVDLPGHPNGIGYNRISDYAEFLFQKTREMRLMSIVAVGHSMGGAIAIEIALTHPEILSGLVLASSGARLRVNPMIVSEVMRDYAHAAEVIAEWAYSPKTDERLRRASVRELLEVPAEVTYRDFQACDHFDRMNEIAKISIPTLIVCGEDDKLTPLKYSRNMMDKIQYARLVTIPDAGHSVMLEKPEELNAALRSFFNELRATGLDY